MEASRHLYFDLAVRMQRVQATAGPAAPLSPQPPSDTNNAA
jgi:hypothetical protein